MSYREAYVNILAKTIVKDFHSFRFLHEPAVEFENIAISHKYRRTYIYLRQWRFFREYGELASYIFFFIFYIISTIYEKCVLINN